MILHHLITAVLATCAPLSATAATISPRKPQEATIPAECIAAVVEAPPLPPSLSFTELPTDAEARTVSSQPLLIKTVFVTVAGRTITVRETAVTAVGSSPSFSSSSLESFVTARPTPVSSPPSPSSASPTRVVDCNTICTCDESSPDFFMCISNPDCEECLRNSKVPLQTRRARLL